MTTPASSQLQQHTTSDDPSSDNRRPAYQQWSRPQLLFFLNLLFEARVNGALDSSRNANLTQSLERVLPAIDEAFPRRSWTVNQLKYQYRQLKASWRIFREIANWSGVEYDEETGLLHMSDDLRQRAIGRWPKEGLRIIRKPLLITRDRDEQNISWETWQTIFSDDPPAGRQITEVDDDEGQFESLVTARIEEEGEEEPGPVAVSDIDEEEGEEESPPTDEVIICDTQVSSTPARGLESPVRSRKKRKLPAIAANTSIEDARKKTRSVEANTDLAIGRLADALAAHFAEAQRYPGSTDLERAVRDVLAYTKGRSDRLRPKLISWLREDHMNPVVWNSLLSDEDKQVFIKDTIDPDIE